MTSFLFWTEP